MITCNSNNFGASPITLRDYQSTRLCILHGKIEYSPANEDYQSAERLEVALPSGFQLRRSAMSSAILMGDDPVGHHGTLIRCWIEGGKLCFEKFTAFDECETMTIYVSSAFVPLGYHGDLTDTERSRLTPSFETSFEYLLYVLKDDYLQLYVNFRGAPSTFDGPGPFSIKLDGFPTDIDTDVVFVDSNGTRSRGEIGSRLIPAHISNGHLMYRYHPDAINMGGTGCFLLLFIPRNPTVAPRVQQTGKVEISLDGSEHDESISTFAFSVGSTFQIATIDATMSFSKDTSSRRKSLCKLHTR